MKYIFYFLLLPSIAFSQQFSQPEINRYKTESKNVTIIRDNWGIPHIYGKTDADAVFGLMYAQCEDDFKRVEFNYLENLGRLSEATGENNLYTDLQMRLIYDSSAAMYDYNTSPAWFKKLLDAFADGVNFYLYKHPSSKPAVLFHFEPWYALM
ncbi:MAG TPA: penicillin acylase family protein, partial [Chitinophagaceae bacterium]|nr:penicillin acylase family protein [Chitinophagaceae bacterium]